MNCPVCNVALVMSERQGFEIDYCPKCRGIWLEKGKLDKIIERSVPAAAPEPPRPVAQPFRQEEQYNKPYDKHQNDHHDGYHHKKKKGIFDLFD